MALNPALRKLVSNAKKKYARNTTNAVRFLEGKTTIRLLAKDFSEQFWRDVGVHWIKTEKNGKPVAVVGCEHKTHDKHCEVCAAIEAAKRAAPDDETLEILKDMEARSSVLVVALVRKHPGDKASDDPQIVEMTPTTWSKMLEIMEEYGEETDVFDLEEGIDFVVTRSGRGFDTEYSVMPAPKSKPVDPKVLDHLPDLDDYIEKNFFRGDEQKALNAIASMSGTAAALPSAASAGLLTSAIDDDEDEGEDVNLDLGEDEEEEAPKASAKKTTAAKKAASKAKPAPVEDEDEDEEDAEIDGILDEIDLEDELDDL